MSDLQTHIDNLQTYIEAIPTDTPTWENLADAFGEVFFLLNELSDIVKDFDAIYDK